MESRMPKYPVDFASLERTAAEVLPWWLHRVSDPYRGNGRGNCGAQVGP
jgi:hypothetical protein